MKVNILADQSGKILSVGYMDSSPELILGNKCSTSFSPSEGQSIIELDLPDELYRHIVENTLGQEIFKYRVESQDDKKKLVKTSN
jgi:hypothetical protein